MNINSTSIDMKMVNFDMDIYKKQGNGKSEKGIEGGSKISLNVSYIEINISSTNFSEANNLWQSLSDRLKDINSGTEEEKKNIDNVLDFLSGKEKNSEGEDIFSLKDLGYTGKPISQLTPEEASDLISEDGFFGVKKTAQREIDFVLNFAKDDIELIKEGRKGMIQGFKEAEKIWGGKLPDIAYKTQEVVLKALDKRIEELGGHSLDIEG
jgi:hypothetical protein